MSFVPIIDLSNDLQTNRSWFLSNITVREATDYMIAESVGTSRFCYVAIVASQITLRNGSIYVLEQLKLCSIT